MVKKDAAGPRHHLVSELLRLQCQMTGCRQGRVEQWDEWADRNLVSLPTDDAVAFCQRAHQLFLDESRTQFLEWKWDFLSALFDGKPCNCVCGTLFLLAAAEWVGLFPDRVRAFAGPTHIWVGAFRRGEWTFVETTLSPRHERYLMTEHQARRVAIYGHGAWFQYVRVSDVVQEAFINQLLNSARQSDGRRHLVAQLCRWRRDTPDDRLGELVLDLRQLYVREAAARVGHGDADQRAVVESMIDTVARRPEPFVKNVAFCAKWATWAAPQDDLVKRRILDVARDLQTRLGSGQWSMDSPFLRNQWRELVRVLGAWRRQYPHLWTESTTLTSRR